MNLLSIWSECCELTWLLNICWSGNISLLMGSIGAGGAELLKYGMIKSEPIIIKMFHIKVC